MVLNRRGITYLYRLMFGVTIIILAIALANPTKVVLTESMLNLNCNAPASDFDQGACWFIDGMKFLFVGGVTMIGFAVLFNKL